MNLGQNRTIAFGLPMHPDDLIHLDQQDPRKAAQKRRRHLLQRYGGRCLFCWVGEANTLDHLIPRAKGGTDADDNLHGACSRCNFSKSDENAMTWYRRQHFYSPEGEARIREWEV